MQFSQSRQIDNKFKWQTDKTDRHKNIFSYRSRLLKGSGNKPWKSLKTDQEIAKGNTKIFLLRNIKKNFKCRKLELY